MFIAVGLLARWRDAASPKRMMFLAAAMALVPISRSPLRHRWRTNHGRRALDRRADVCSRLGQTPWTMAPYRPRWLRPSALLPNMMASMTAAEAQWMLYKAADDGAARIRANGLVLTQAEVRSVTRNAAMHGPRENFLALPESIEISVEDIERVMRETAALAPATPEGSVPIANALHARIRSVADELGAPLEVMSAKERDRAICDKLGRRVSPSTIKVALKGTPHLKARRGSA